MALVTWDRFLPLLAPHVPGVPDVTMRQALAVAASDFLGRTHLWRARIDPQDTVPGEANYTLYADAVIESIMWVRAGDAELCPTDVRDVPSLPVTSGRPTHYWRVSDTTICLYPTPDAIVTLDALVALKPARTAAGVEGWIHETWAEDIVEGALWSLTRIPHKPWSDDKLAQIHKIRFDRAIANARVRDVRQLNPRVRFQVR